MDCQPELAVLFASCAVGTAVFGRFEAETPPWRLIARWGLLAALVLWLRGVVGHAAAAVPAVLGAFGLVAHVAWCRRHGIHPLRAEPRRRYYRLRGWRWPAPDDDEPD